MIAGMPLTVEIPNDHADYGFPPSTPIRKCSILFEGPPVAKRAESNSEFQIVDCRRDSYIAPRVERLMAGSPKRKKKRLTPLSVVSVSSSDPSDFLVTHTPMDDETNFHQSAYNIEYNFPGLNPRLAMVERVSTPNSFNSFNEDELSIAGLKSTQIQQASFDVIKQTKRKYELPALARPSVRTLTSPSNPKRLLATMDTKRSKTRHRLEKLFVDENEKQSKSISSDIVSYSSRRSSYSSELIQSSLNEIEDRHRREKKMWGSIDFKRKYWDCLAD